MAERANLVVEARDSSKEKAKQLRRLGWIPAVVYGQGSNKDIKVERLPLRRVLRNAGTTSLIDLQVGNDNVTVLAKEVQQHPTRGDLIHVDFYEVNMKEKLIVEAALVPVGVAPPVEEGLGTTSLVIYSVEVECLPGNLISEIEIDMSMIETPDDVITVADLTVPEGVEVLTEPDFVVARFDFIQEEEEEEEEEELLFAPSADDVEVIGKGKADEEEEDEE
jgi:large subunit ribosomal protein L25